MQEDRTDLVVFIDLGFILLVGFLILAETTPREIVALPGESEDPPAQVDASVIFNVHFAVNLQFLIESGSAEVCAPSGVEQLVSCMAQVAETNSSAVFMLVPRGRAPVQHLVSLLDLCRSHGWRCTVRT